MKKRIDPKDIHSISFNYETSVMEIFNYKNLLLYKEVTTEDKFNKSVSKLLEAKVA